jgi:hypothetical protein
VKTSEEGRRKEGESKRKKEKGEVSPDGFYTFQQ